MHHLFPYGLQGSVLFLPYRQVNHFSAALFDMFVAILLDRRIVIFPAAKSNNLFFPLSDRRIIVFSAVSDNCVSSYLSSCFAFSLPFSESIVLPSFLLTATDEMVIWVHNVYPSRKICVMYHLERFNLCCISSLTLLLAAQRYVSQRSETQLRDTSHRDVSVSGTAMTLNSFFSLSKHLERFILYCIGSYSLLFAAKRNVHRRWCDLW